MEGCNSTFWCKSQLKGHQKSAHKVWVCEERGCGKSYTRKHDRKLHMEKKHKRPPPPGEEEEEPKFTCYICKKPLGDAKSLSQHEDRCKGVTKRQCKTCKKWVANASDIRNHQLMHQRADAKKARRE